MKLSKVEIQGFKSFADRTVVKFDSDIVAIVGPNGCGKSNIADAIRWAMGEQSSKRLRAQGMENIVFSGSDTRGPMSMAEVTLFFENDGNFQHPIYGSCSEISVSRRYFHAQESAYFINNVPCRRKDITELLSDAGASARIYSVVEQGRIGWIVMSKPEEKRALIEEAAGVSNYKDTIGRTQRKMEKIRANLLRISDIIREMKSNLISLRRQAKRAERHNRYMEELKDAELWQASHLFLGLVQQRSALNAGLESMRCKKEEVHRTITGTEAEMELLGSEVTQVEETIQDLQDKLYRSNNDSALLDANIDNSIREVHDIRKKAQSDLEEIEKTKKKVHQSREELDGLSEKGQELKDRIERERDKLSAVRAELETIKGRQDQQQKMQEENREKMVRLASNIASVQAKKEEGRKNAGNLAGKLEELTGEKAAAEEKIAAVDADIRIKRKEKKRLEELLYEQQDERRRLVGLRESGKEETARQELEIISVDEEILEARSALQSLQSSIDEVKAELESSRSVCSEISSTLLSDKIACSEGFEKAAWAVLERFLDCVVVGDVEEALYWHLTMLKRSEEGTAFIARCSGDGSASSDPPLFLEDDDGTIVSLRWKVTATPDVAPLMDKLLRDVYVAYDVSHAVALHKKYGDRATFVTRDGEIVTSQGTLHMAGESNAREKLPGLESRFAVERETMQILGAARQKLVNARDERRSTAKAQAEKIEELGARIHGTEMAAIIKHEEIANASTTFNSLCGLIFELNAKIESASSQREETKNETMGISESLPSLFSDLSALKSQQNKIDARIEDIRREVEDKMILTGSHSSTIESIEREQVEIEEDIGRLKVILGEHEERNLTLEEAVVNAARSDGRKIAQIFMSGEKQEELKARIDRLSRDIEDCRNSHADKKFKTREKEAIIKTLRHEMEETERECYNLQSDILSVSGEVEKITQSVELRWRLALEDVVYTYHTRPRPDDTTAERITELTRILERMGPVNVLAIEDYRSTEEKYDFYLKEKTDLEEALENLTQAITKMNREYRRRFIEAFNTVNENFKKMFPLLFCGGHGYLELVDPSRVLESGVEIKAQPPGKKLGSLDMMSNGEKALTAIALIFSIFKYRPSPFCILDEVDAPLDEANVKRFNDMLRAMTDKSQFILMTHTKLSMQSSDILYGVTMQEPGISKIISTKINKIKTSQGELTAVA